MRKDLKGMNLCRNAKWIQVFNSQIFGKSDADRGASVVDTRAFKGGGRGDFIKPIR